MLPALVGFASVVVVSAVPVAAQSWQSDEGEEDWGVVCTASQFIDSSGRFGDVKLQLLGGRGRPISAFIDLKLENYPDEYISYWTVDDNQTFEFIGGVNDYFGNTEIRITNDQILEDLRGGSLLEIDTDEFGLFYISLEGSRQALDEMAACLEDEQFAPDQSADAPEIITAPPDTPEVIRAPSDDPDITAASADDPNSTSAVLIYEEKVEIYFNLWSGIRVNDASADQATVYIKGEGKTVDFDGVMSINCEAMSGYSWITGAFWSGETPATEALYQENIPSEVISGARELFCHIGP
jgi:hypothetical protein